MLSSRGCFLQDSQTSKIIGTGRKVGRLFELTSFHFPSPIISAAVTSSLWHARLGHLSSSKLDSLISSGYLGHVKTENLDCVSCQLSKHHALPFSSSDSISSAPFDLVHSDI